MLRGGSTNELGENGPARSRRKGLTVSTSSDAIPPQRSSEGSPTKPPMSPRNRTWFNRPTSPNPLDQDPRPQPANVLPPSPPPIVPSLQITDESGEKRSLATGWFGRGRNGSSSIPTTIGGPRSPFIWFSKPEAQPLACLEPEYLLQEAEEKALPPLPVDAAEGVGKGTGGWFLRGFRTRSTDGLDRHTADDGMGRKGKGKDEFKEFEVGAVEREADEGVAITANSMLQLIAAEMQLNAQEDNDRQDIIPSAGDVTPPDERSSIHNLIIHGPRTTIKPGKISAYLDAGVFGLPPSGTAVSTPDADPVEWSVLAAEDEENGKKALTVEEKIKIAFELPTVEEYRGGWYPFFICEKHICFYANLPAPEIGIIQKSGFLGKRPRAGTRLQYTTYWFSLKNDVLYYFENSTDLYFPTGGINLKYAITVEPSKSKENGFKIITPRKKYYLLADTETLRKEWIAALKASIFRARNEGSDVRIVLPLSNITNITHTKTSPFTDTLEVQIMDTELLVTEEYYFSYFNDMEQAYVFLKDLWEKRPRGPESSESRARFRRRRSLADASVSVHPMADESNARKRLSMPNLEDVDASSLPKFVNSGSGSVPSSPTKKGGRDSSQTLVRSPSSPFMKGERVSPTKPRMLHHRRSESDYIFKFMSGGEGEGGTVAGKASEEGEETGKDKEGGIAEQEGSSRWGWRGHRKSFSDASEMEAFAASQRGEEFREQFAMPDSEVLLSAFTCYLVRVLPRLGKIYISENYICFQSKLVGIRTKVIIPISDVITAQRDKQREIFYHGLFLLLRDQSEVYFEFYSSDLRNKCLDLITGRIRACVGGRGDMPSPERRVGTRRHLAVLDDVHQTDHHFKLDFSNVELSSLPPINGTLRKTRPSPMHITCLTIGTRGDVQPYIALCKGLMAHGHTCRIATHLEYQSWIESHGIEFREVKGNPAELMQCCVDNGMFTVSFIRDAASKFRGWIDELLVSSWEACQGTQLLIESPTAMAGIHIAEKLDIPFFGAFSMPWTRTRAFPHPFAVTERHLGGGYNYMSYVMMDQILWKGTSAQVNRWRKNTLDRPPIVLGNIGEHKIPYLYFFSPAIVPPPSDWHDWIHMTGYWFLDSPEVGWEAPLSLLRFLDEGPPPVYIGFGSIIVPDPDALTRTIIEAVRKAGVRAIVSKGWSARMKEAQGEEISFPEFIYQLDKVPHDWLFPRMAGVVHHGGCGTTGAGIRAGVPTAIRPYFGDQFFWADRIQELGVGCAIRKLTVDKLASALTSLVSDDKMRERARLLGVRIRAEDGVGTAIDCIYRDLEFARSRVRRLAQVASPGAVTTATASSPVMPPGDGVKEDEEEVSVTLPEGVSSDGSTKAPPLSTGFTPFKGIGRARNNGNDVVAAAHPDALP
ncbi:Sterol 3-beta-glucosyltransferase [Dinochytrium kinnereticum]|nr:Sterol 3-beta-glucosyltransferase [Dinochytrium kinnereticum]